MLQGPEICVSIFHSTNPYQQCFALSGGEPETFNVERSTAYHDATHLLYFFTFQGSSRSTYHHRDSLVNMEELRKKNLYDLTAQKLLIVCMLHQSILFANIKYQCKSNIKLI